MAITKQKKEELVAQYLDLIEQSKAIFVTQYSGMSVKNLENLRKEVRNANGLYRITKNTLLKLALEKANRPTPPELLAGQLATGFALEEAPALAKTLVDFAKSEDALSVQGGILGTDILSADQVEALAKLPSLDELRAQIIGLLNGPARNVASILNSGVQQLVNVLDAYAKSEEATETA